MSDISRHNSPRPKSVRTPVGSEAEDCSSPTITEDGRVDIDLQSHFNRTLSKVIRLPQSESGVAPPPAYRRYGSPDQFPVRLNIVIQVVGSRGDVQPFVALGNGLQKHGHRVRLATHAKFEDFVLGAGLQFYPIGGDPEDLMAYMLKNPGLLPSFQSIRRGDVSDKRKTILEMLEGCWDSCISPDPLSGEPFVADAIIANPPSFAHVHCSEALGIPLHLMFTMPWTATAAFPHPLANIFNGAKNPRLANYLSYAVVEMMTWQGLGDVINAWRRSIGLERVPLTEGPSLASNLSIPFTYCWSPALMAKPDDWPAHIDVSGFFFRDAPDYIPSDGLRAFIEAGPPPVYIGFGSIVLDNAAAMSFLILEAVEECGYRAIISRGWSRLDGPAGKDVFWLENCPHEWLFQHVSAVVHHGGAGTTACGLRNARPTVIVPFFGDQPFWGDMVATAGAGPKPIPHRSLDAKNLAAALRFCHEPATRSAVATIAEQMRQEDGVSAAIMSFLNNLQSDEMRCDFLPDQPATWRFKVNGRPKKISRLAAEVLVESKCMESKVLKEYRTSCIIIENRRWDPTTGLLSSTIGVGMDMIGDAAGVVLEPAAEYRRGRSRSADPSGGGNGGNGGKAESASLASSTSSVQTTTARKKSSDQVAIAGSMALASGKSLGKIIPTFYRGAFVEIALAITEGFRNIPRIWGDTPASYGEVRDWKSGSLVAAKSVTLGMRDGVRDLAMMPVRSAKEEGWLGGVKGVAKGSGSLASKTLGGSLGLGAYPGQGIAKTIWASAHAGAGARVRDSRRAEGKYAAQQASEEVKEQVREVYDKAKAERKAFFAW
ncbi:hypothetical protein CKM354_000932900 [Cercospora kikuchii]|uniref:Glycosyltransferase family 28 N-terminal domain-containing protein n=1 Tax=Cercospora kikuchii TaxID=84275 RepID=A0A9P3CNU9_9PEZI|nr:uncharacterized protein CKM354_000932900 [Cercospora kikuchii]GIZ46193.1 hypothetical protein CKM354_000932900 [Cercospora kikuchii]